MLSDSKLGLDHASGRVTRRKCRLRPWLQTLIDSQDIPGLCWLDNERTKFKIPWKHGGKQDWSPESGRVFMASCLFRLQTALLNVKLRFLRPIGLNRGYMWTTLFWNNFEIISVFCFTDNHVWNWNKVISVDQIISKLVQQHWTC